MSIDAKWGSRVESAQEVAVRVVKTLRGLQSLHPALARWYPADNKAKAWPRKQPLDPDGSGTVQRVMGSFEPVSPYERTSYVGTSLTCWNGTVDGYDIFLMCSAGRTVVNLENSFRVTWGIFAPTDTTLLKDRALTEKVMEVLIDAWEPDWCQVAGYYTPKLGRYENVNPVWMVPVVGWLLYLSKRRLSRKDVPSAHEVRPMGKDGTLIVVSDQMVGTSEPEDWALSNRVREELGLPFPYTIYELPEEMRIPPPDIRKRLKEPDPLIADLLREEERKERGKGRKKRR